MNDDALADAVLHSYSKDSLIMRFQALRDHAIRAERQAEGLRAELAALRPLAEAAARYRAAVAAEERIDFDQFGPESAEWLAVSDEYRAAKRAVLTAALESER